MRTTATPSPGPFPAGGAGENCEPHSALRATLPAGGEGKKDAAHVIKRLRERFGLDVTARDLADLRGAARAAGRPVVGAQSTRGGGQWREVRWRGRSLWVCVNADCSEIYTVVHPGNLPRGVPTAMMRRA